MQNTKTILVRKCFKKYTIRKFCEPNVIHFITSIDPENSSFLRDDINFCIVLFVQKEIKLAFDSF